MLLEEGLMIIEEAIKKAHKFVEGYPETKFTAEEYMKFHGCVYVLCAHSGAGAQTNATLLYGRFEKSLEDSILYTVLPSLAAKENELLLRELVLMWSNYKLMARWLCRFFEYLGRYGHVSLSETSINCFRNLVLLALDCRILPAALSLIDQERQGKQIDPKLLQDVLNLFMEIDKNGLPSYYEFFELALFEKTASFYSQLASQWLLYDSLTDYVQKVNWCVIQEKERASRYLQPISMEKLLQVVRCKLLDMNKLNKLLERQRSDNRSQVDYQYQEILSKCAGLTLEEESSSTSMLGASLSALMAKSAHIN